MANSVDPDQTPRFAASDLDPHCLLLSTACSGLSIRILTVNMVLFISAYELTNALLTYEGVLKHEECVSSGHCYTMSTHESYLQIRCMFSSSEKYHYFSYLKYQSFRISA